MENWYDKFSDDVKKAGISSLANRPTQPATYGEGGLSAEQLKKRFDYLALQLIDKINGILDGVKDGSFAEQMKLPAITEGVISLADLVKAIDDGTFANKMLKVGTDDQVLLETLLEELKTALYATQASLYGEGGTPADPSAESLSARVNSSETRLSELSQAVEELPSFSASPLVDAAPLYSADGSLAVMVEEGSQTYEGPAVPIPLLEKKLEGVGAKLDLALDPSSYELTARLLNEDGTELSAQIVDLPLEMAFVGAKLSEDSKWIIFTLQNGSEVTVPISEIAGKFNIVEGTGTRTDAVMSQASTTKALDGKLDKLDPTVDNGLYRLYTMLPEGVEGYLPVASSVGSVHSAGRIPMYFTSGSGTTIGNPNTVLLTGDPTAEYDASNKKYVDDGDAANKEYVDDVFVAKSQVQKAGGISIVNDMLALDTLNDNEVIRKKQDNVALKARNVDAIVKAGITTNTYTLTDEEKASACNWIGVDRQIALMHGQKTITVFASNDGMSNTPQALLVNPTGYALVNMIGATMHDMSGGEPYEVAVEKLSFKEVDSVVADKATALEQKLLYAAKGNDLNLTGTLEAGVEIDLDLEAMIDTTVGKTVTATITGSYTGHDGDAMSTPPRVQFMLANGSYENNSVFLLYGQSSYTASIPSIAIPITSLRLIGGTYDVDFSCTINVSVAEMETYTTPIVHNPAPIKEVVLYKDYSTLVRKYTIPDEILALPSYGLGISETVYNYIDFDEQIYVQMCNEYGALAAPVTTDISAYLTDFDGVVEVNGATMISFERGDGNIMYLPAPYKLMYHSKV